MRLRAIPRVIKQRQNRAERFLSLPREGGEVEGMRTDKNGNRLFRQETRSSSGRAFLSRTENVFFC
jgi:hypothetical protein